MFAQKNFSIFEKKIVMEHKLPVLPYELNALEPVLSKRTLEFHYGKHHQTYVNNLNQLIKGTTFENSDLLDIIKNADGAIFNNAAQVWNHTFYFEAFSPNPKPEPSGKLMELINKSFQSFENFKNIFSQKAVTLFGSGWTWLIYNEEQDMLEIIQTSNADTPIKYSQKALLTCDVWEHAYYLDYQNRRADYVKEFWKIVDWKVVENRL